MQATWSYLAMKGLASSAQMLSGDKQRIYCFSASSLSSDT